MLLIIVALLWSMKSVVVNEARLLRVAHRLSFFQWMAFSLAWPGMRPGLFKRLPNSRVGDFATYIQRGLVRMSLGTACFSLAYLIWNRYELQFPTSVSLFELFPPNLIVVCTLLVMMSFSLIIHFGLFNILTGVWRYFGVKCNVLFVAPFASTSLTEFWGQRWNLAFSEMTVQAVYRPVKQAFGKSAGTYAGFIFSGLLHELAISVPAKAGWGFPMLYFLLHGFAMHLESQYLKRYEWFNNRSGLGRIWTLMWLLVPLPILFHGPFLAGCVWPLLCW